MWSTSSSNASRSVAAPRPSRSASNPVGVSTPAQPGANSASSSPRRTANSFFVSARAAPYSRRTSHTGSTRHDTPSTRPLGAVTTSVVTAFAAIRAGNTS
ncbi:hypothetical protein ABT187_45710 [Streptomyces sp. NPDC001817]|uniref:hypothetical protein n=1 Tax=Streptomyces sp. NPDC001817 TaxID=3154398 RepID=UPI00331DA735